MIKKDKMLSLRMSGQNRALLTQMAHTQGLTVSDFILELAKTYVKKQAVCPFCGRPEASG